ncbi:MAG: spore protease YyaC [Syntrophomonadaceae bacterium]
METVKIFYDDKLAAAVLAHNLGAMLAGIEQKPLILCIGSDRHLLDCLGPLTGTMLQESFPGIEVIGTLQNPLHARNMVHTLEEMKPIKAGQVVIAVDASVGNQDEIGLLQLRPGSLVPGKAMARNLPAVGDYALTGVVELRANKSGIRNRQARLGLVYDMARVISQAIAECYQFKFGFQ